MCKQLIAPLILLSFLSSCIGITEVDPTNSSRRDSQVFAGTGQGYIYKDNPNFLTGKSYVSRANFTDLVEADFVTLQNYLQSHCAFSQYISSTYKIDGTLSDECFLVLNNSSASTTALTSKNNSWAYDIGSDEFYQVNTFYHVNKVIERFSSALSFAHKTVHFNSTLKIPPATKYNLIDTQSYWLTEDGSPKTMKVYAKCYLEKMNAFFSPALSTLCFGWNNDDQYFRMVQDPAIIYHEVGHALVKVMMNQRNITSGVDPNTNMFAKLKFKYSSDLGYLDYDEAGSINEGIADYFSYLMNGREQIGEFAFTNLGLKARPFSEDNANHTADISTVSGERLQYPDYLFYNPSFSTKNEEDVHNSGQIITHYLVALTKKLKNVCSFGTTDSNLIHEKATNYVFTLLNETLAELGDLTGKGSDYLSMYATDNLNQENTFFVNLNNENSFEWQSVVNPINFRKFARTMAKNSYYYLEQGLCPGFDKDTSEKLLDDFGLLLFRSYDDKRIGMDTNTKTDTFEYIFGGETLQSLGNTSQVFSPNLFITNVEETNRRNTVLVSKDFIKVDPDVSLYLFDGREKMSSIISSLTFEGENVTTTEGIADVVYNNNNIKISPGEVVGIALNLFNNSNSQIGGVQLLANDWDHMKVNKPSNIALPYTYVYNDTNGNGLNNGDITGFRATHSPCIFDNFPKASEGGVTDSSSTTEGNCSYISRTNEGIDTSEIVGGVVYSKYDLDAPQPICLVQYSDENETKWVSQDFHRKYGINTPLEDSKCLNNPSKSGNNFNPNECLIRFLPGAQTATYGKIDPQKNYVDTIRGDSKDEFIFNASNVVIMEVNKYITPGTTFNCRMRVRHSNCSDCFDSYDGSDYYEAKDYEFGGASLYKLINFKFTVID